MSDILTRISSFAPPARLALYINTMGFFDQVGYTDHELDVEQADTEDAGATDILGSLEFQLLEHLTLYLNGLGVWLSVEASTPLATVLEIAEGCATIVMDPPEDGYLLLTDDPDPQWELATVLANLREVPRHDLMVAIGFTDGRLLQHLIPPDERDNRSEEPGRAVERYRSYVTEIGLRTGDVYQFIQTRNRLPLYLAGTAKALGPTIADSDPAVWAHEWASMGLASELPDEEVMDAALGHAQRYTDPAVFVRFSAILESVIKEHTHDPV